MACLRLAARTASKSTSVNRARSRLRIAAIFSSSSSSSTSSRPQNSATTSTVMSSAVGPEAAAGDDQVDSLAGQEPQLRRDVGGPVAADRDVGQLDAEFEQPIGDPRPLRSDPPGQHLCPGDDDACACAHAPMTLRTSGTALAARELAAPARREREADRVRARRDRHGACRSFVSCTSRLPRFTRRRACPRNVCGAVDRALEAPRACPRPWSTQTYVGVAGVIRSATRARPRGLGLRRLCASVSAAWSSGADAWSAAAARRRSPDRWPRAARHDPHQHEQRSASPGPECAARPAAVASRPPPAARAAAAPSRPRAR